jgi:hypothetical protein
MFNNLLLMVEELQQIRCREVKIHDDNLCYRVCICGFQVDEIGPWLGRLTVACALTMGLMRMVNRIMFQLGSGSSVSDLVELTYWFLSSDIAVVFDLVGNHVHFCIVLLVSDVLLMPLNCLYCADYAVG